MHEASVGVKIPVRIPPMTITISRRAGTASRTILPRCAQEIFSRTVSSGRLRA